MDVAAFALDVRPVTNAEFLAFVRREPAWRRDSVKRVHADPGYLSHWASPDALGSPASDNRPDQPVTRVSWYAAKAYCHARGRRLPSEVEWELAAAASETELDARADPAFQRRILAWYAQPASRLLGLAGGGVANRYGVRDLHGLVWEWVYDFNNTMVTGDNRERGSPRSADVLRRRGAGRQRRRRLCELHALRVPLVVGRRVHRAQPRLPGARSVTEERVP